MEKVCIYLRKSRADVEKERIEEFETLSRHRSVLVKYAKENKLNITKIYEELESGESIIHRPEMIKLLKEVEEKKYCAVLCMDIDRLGRGNMQEQGLILETFKNSDTKIVTPRKTYNLSDDFDQEYSEFEAFMARKELKLINRRLQSGRIRSIEEGNYISTSPPYGYSIILKDKKRTLTPNEEQAEVVKLIFNLYINENVGCNKIANRLNELGYKTYTNTDWKPSSVLNIIKNPAYTGKLVWKKKSFTKSKTPDKARESKSNPKSEWLIIDNCHDAIISDSDFNLAHKKLKSRYHVPYVNKVTNPLAGILKCEMCKSSMVYRPYTKGEAHIMCHNNCGNKSSKFVLVEKQIIKGLTEMLESHRDLIKNYDAEQKPQKKNDNELEYRLKKLEKESQALDGQRNNLYDLLEKGVYDINTFLERSQILSERIKRHKDIIENTRKEAYEKARINRASKELIPKIQNVIDYYYALSSAEHKNIILKSVISYIDYYKEKSWKNEHFNITIYFNI